MIISKDIKFGTLFRWPMYGWGPDKYYLFLGEEMPGNQIAVNRGRYLKMFCLTNLNIGWVEENPLCRCPE